MSDDIVSLNEARAVKAADNTLWSPLECLKAVVRDVEAGVCKPVKVFIVMEEEGPGKRNLFTRYRSNLPRDQEIAILEICKHRAVSDWLDS